MRIERCLESDVSDYASTLDRLRRIAAGQEESLLRLSRPTPIVGFGRRDELNPGFDAARAACERHGFTPWVRTVGGRAAAFHEDCMIVDHLVHDADATSGNMRRYREFGELYVRALESLGVRAEIGELPLEYCPGEFSVNGATTQRTRVKLIGTAQRVVAGGWWFSAGIVIAGPDPLRAVLTDVYEALGITMAPRTVGSVSMAVPAVQWEDVEDAVLEQYEEWNQRCADDMSSRERQEISWAASS